MRFLFANASHSSFYTVIIHFNDSPYKLCFGPKSFLVISDPVQARHILRDANVNYDKGVLAEILEPIMVREHRCCLRAALQ